MRGKLKTSNNTALERVQKEEEELGILFHFLFTVKAFCNISVVEICVHARALGFIFLNNLCQVKVMLCGDDIFTFSLQDVIRLKTTSASQTNTQRCECCC